MCYLPVLIRGTLNLIGKTIWAATALYWTGWKLFVSSVDSWRLKVFLLILLEK